MPSNQLKVALGQKRLGTTALERAVLAGYREEQRLERMGAETSVIEKKHKRYPMTQEQKKKPGKHQDLGKR